MVKKNFLTLSLLLIMINFASCQGYEYVLENADSKSSCYIAYQKKHINHTAKVQIVNSNGYGIETTVKFTNQMDTIILHTDSLGHASLKFSCRNSSYHFSTPALGNRYNGVCGYVDFLQTNHLLIILGNQSICPIRIKSTNRLSSDELRTIANIIRDGGSLAEYQNISIEAIIEI